MYPIPFIMIVVYLIIEFIKVVSKNIESVLRLLPIISAILGACISIAIFYLSPNSSISTNILVCVIDGIFAGLSATGSNQLIKQLNKFKIDKININKSNDNKEK